MVLQLFSGVNDVDSDGDALFMTAAYHDHHKVLEVLLQSDTPIDVNQQNGRKKTALHNAAGEGHRGPVDVLLKQPGIDVSYKMDQSYREMIFDILHVHTDIPFFYTISFVAHAGSVTNNVSPSESTSLTPENNLERKQTNYSS